MKKFFSLVVVMLVAALSFDASAQSSKLFGEWSLDTTNAEARTGNEIKLALEFDDDYDGEMKLLINIEQPIEEGVTINVSVSLDADIAWSLVDDMLTIKTKDIDLDIENLYITPVDPAYESCIPMFKRQMKRKLNAQKAEIINNLALGQTIVTFVDNDTMVLTTVKSNEETVCKRIY